MEATKRSMGRPKKAPKAAPIAVPQVKSNKKTTSKVKRKLVDDAKKTKVYKIKNGGGIWYKLRQRNITIFDEETKSVRELIYAANENSVFGDEHSDTALREQIIFKNKELYVTYQKPNLAKYLDLHPDNIANGGSEFYLEDNQKVAEVEIESEFAVVDAVAMVRDKSIDELIPVAMFLGIDINQKNIEIKRELLIKAKSNPTGFMQMFDNPVVKVRSTIMSAVDFQILKSDNDGLRWFDTNGLIVSTPSGQDTIDVATRFCLSEKGATVYEEIQNQLSKI